MDTTRRRRCGLAGFVGCVVLTAGWVLDEIGVRHYDAVRDTISALGSMTTQRAPLWNTIISASGLCIAILAAGLWSDLGARGGRRVGVVLVAIGGVGFFIDGFVRLDTTNAITLADALRTGSWHQHVHIIESLIDVTALTAAPFVLAPAFRWTPGWDRLVGASYGLGSVIAVSGLWFLIDNQHGGIAERALVGGIATWLAIVGGHLAQLNSSQSGAPTR